MPQWGAWTAELVLDSADAAVFAAGTRVTLATDDGGLSLVGTVRAGRTGVFMDSTRLRLIAGGGGLPTIVVPKYYQQVTARIVLNYLLEQAGEVVSDTIEDRLIGGSFDRWAVVSQPVSNAVGALVEAIADGLVWRVLPDGTVWVGEESWPAIDPSYEFLVGGQQPNEAKAILDVAKPRVLPGQSIPSLGNVGYVEHVVTDNRVRSTVWLV